MGYVFISYSSKNKDIADTLRNVLIKNRIDTWMAPNDIPAGSKYAQVIGKALKCCSCLVLLLTNESQQSPWVAKEVERAINYRKTIIPIQLEDVLLNDEFEMYISTDQIIAIRKVDESSEDVRRLISTIRALTQPENNPAIVENPVKIHQISIGSVIDGKYRIISMLGRGGFCDVYLAINEKTDRTWALKVIPKGTTQYGTFIKNLSTEISCLNKLNHPGIPSIVDIIEDNQQLLVVMEYIEGIPLSKVVEESGAQDEEVVLQWAIQLCDTLGYLHKQTPAIIHNDIKPGNIMLTPSGKLMLIDFGTARNIDSGAPDTLCLGTAYYAAPETFASGHIDQRTDIYSLGVTMYSIITGSDPSIPPYMIYPIRKVNPSLSTGFEYIISKCIERDPKDRYQSMQELLFDLQNIDKISRRLAKTKPLQKLMSLFKDK